MNVLQGASRYTRATCFCIAAGVATLFAPIVEASEVVKLTRIVIIGKRPPAQTPSTQTSSGTNAATPVDRNREPNGSLRQPSAPLRWFKANPA